MAAKPVVFQSRGDPGQRSGGPGSVGQDDLVAPPGREVGSPGPNRGGLRWKFRRWRSSMRLWYAEIPRWEVEIVSCESNQGTQSGV